MPSTKASSRAPASRPGQPLAAREGPGAPTGLSRTARTKHWLGSYHLQLVVIGPALIGIAQGEIGQLQKSRICFSASVGRQAVAIGVDKLAERTESSPQILGRGALGAAAIGSDLGPTRRFANLPPNQRPQNCANPREKPSLIDAWMAAEQGDAVWSRSGLAAIGNATRTVPACSRSCATGTAALNLTSTRLVEGDDY